MSGSTAVRLLVATRSADKLREIRVVLAGVGVEALSLDDVGLPEVPEEDAVEVHPTFRENALAKARFQAERAVLPTLADDSGLVVEHLGGLPGVRSKRFAADAGTAAAGEGVDGANNRMLLERLDGVADAQRSAWYVCAAAVVVPGGATLTALGTWRGRIAREPAGNAGFGYDPLFWLEADGCTVAQLPPGAKERRSHRARAVRAVAASGATLLR